MRSRRSKGGLSAFSLFAFQDIMTSTIGIIIVIMLQLVSQITSAATSANSNDGTNQTIATDAQLQESIELNSKIIEKLEGKSIREAIEWIQDQINTHHVVTEKLTQNLIDAIESSDEYDKIDSLHADIIGLSSEIENLKKDVHAALLDSDSAGELEELRSERNRLKYTLDGVLANEALVYIKQADEDHSPFLVEISTQKIIIHGQGINPGLPTLHIADSVLEIRCNTTIKIIQQLRSESLYPLLLVRPGGGEACNYIHNKLFELDVFCGVDLLLEGQTSLPEYEITKGFNR